MKRFSSLLLLLTFVALGFGQDRKDRPDFSGTWRMTESKNIATNDRTGTYSKTLVIVHHEPEIKITIHFTENGQEKRHDEIYFTDGRGETNRTFRDQVVKSMTKWDGSKLEVHHFDTTSTADPSSGAKTFKVELIEKWQLSKDDKVLTKTISVKAPAGVKMVNSTGRGRVKEVFTRSE